MKFELRYAENKLRRGEVDIGSLRELIDFVSDHGEISFNKDTITILSE